MKLKLSEIERESRPEPFSVELPDGTEVVLTDPKHLSVEKLLDIAELNSEVAQVKLLCIDEDFPKLARALDVETFEAVMNAYNAHYGLGDTGKSALSSS